MICAIGYVLIIEKSKERIYPNKSASKLISFDFVILNLQYVSQLSRREDSSCAELSSKSCNVGPMSLDATI